MKKTKRRRWLLILIVMFIALAINEYIKYEDKLKNTPMPEGLHPIVAENRDKLIKASEEVGISILVYEDFRTIEEQNDLYNQGRTTDGNIVTYSKGGESYHNYGLAIDFALQLSDGSVIWDIEYDGNRNGQSDWQEVVQIAKGLGFTWGGDWESFKDYPHLQMNFGLTIRELKRGERPDHIEYAVPVNSEK